MIHKILRLALIIATICFANAASAQDKIYLTDGTTIEAKVREIGPKNIVYRRWDNQEGADYIITRREVNRIVYQNGTEEKFNRSMGPGMGRRGMSRRDEPKTGTRKRSDASDYGKNIIALAPIQMTNESVAGVGIHYEHFVDRDAMFSIYIPVAVSFFEEETGNNGTLKASRTFVNTYPGIKIYPGGSGRRASYSIGGSFGFGFGNKYKETRMQDPLTGAYTLTYTDQSVFKTGFMVNNGLNLQPTKHLYVGLEFGIGILYYNNEQDDYAVGEEAPMVQFNFKMGYRF